MDVVYAKYAGMAITPDGGHMAVAIGQHWQADDPVVKANPQMFSTDPRHGLCGYGTPTPEMLPPVEEATAAPGEKRPVGRPRKNPDA